VRKIIISADKRVDSVSGVISLFRMFMSQRRIKTDDVKDSFYEELECVFDKFPNYHMKIF
jgi:hypothetical protein